jgi:hypothetical protein
MSRTFSLVIALAMHASSLSAQECNLRVHGEVPDPCDAAAHRSGTQRLPGHVKFAAANAALGALTAGIATYVRGESFLEGAVGGATGGVLSYTGKAIATSRFDGSGMVGRQVSALGSSIVLNTSRGAGPFSRVTFPVGPIHVDVVSGPDFSIRPRLDVANILATVIIASDPDTRLNWHYTLSTGALVFVDRGHDRWYGRHTSGVITVKERRRSGNIERDFQEYVVRHERVHLLQGDFTAMTWGRPMEDGILSRIPHGRTVHEHVLFRADLAVWGLMNALMDHSDRPTESEAYFLSPRPRD